MKIEIINKIENLSSVLELIEEYLTDNNIDMGSIFQFNLSIDEFITNIINYAYNDVMEHIIIIEVNIDNNIINAEIIDDGVEFDPLKSKTPDTDLALEDRQIGGLGIHLAKNFLDSITYERISNQNRLKLTKKNNI